MTQRTMFMMVSFSREEADAAQDPARISRPEDLAAAGRVAAKLRQHLNETNTRQ
jgi:hypothetical protein